MATIFLFPYGGGSAASYRRYADRFPRHVGRVVPIELPGRGTRAHEQCAGSIRECAALTLDQIVTTNADYILHGHCMGALLAFEVAKLIEASGQPLPRCMLVSGRNAPGHVNDWLRRVAELDDRRLFEELQHIGGVPLGLSFAMARDFLTVLRHDRAMLRDYDPGAATIPVPILALAGRDDRMTNAPALADWQNFTSKVLSIEWFDGQHYFIFEQLERVARLIEVACGTIDSRARAEAAT